MGFATSMDPDQPAHPRSLVRIHAIRFKTLWGLTKLLANSMDPDQTARMRRLFWIHSGRKAHYVGFATVLLNVFGNTIHTCLWDDLHVTPRIQIWYMYDLNGSMLCFFKKKIICEFSCHAYVAKLKPYNAGTEITAYANQ